MVCTPGRSARGSLKTKHTPRSTPAGSDGSDGGDDLGDAEFERAAAASAAGASARADTAEADAARLRSGSQAAASGSDSDDDPGLGSPREGLDTGGTRPRAPGNKAASFARAFAKVMASGAGKGAAPGAAPILAGSKSLGKRKREEAEAERGDRAARKLRTEMRRRGHIVRPGPHCCILNWLGEGQLASGSTDLCAAEIPSACPHGWPCCSCAVSLGRHA